MNPLDMSGPQFLELFVPLAVLAFAVGLALRLYLRQPGGGPGALPRNLDPYEVAMLSGPNAVVHAALARLLHAGSIRMNGAQLEATGSRQADAPFIERVIYRAVSDGSVTPSELLERAEPAIEKLKPALIQRGWLVDDTSATRARWVPLLPCFAVLLLGLAKISVGLERDRPVGLLVLSCCIIGLGTCFLLGKRVWSSRRGIAVRLTLRRQEQPLRITAGSASSPEALNSHDVGIAVALFGLGAVGLTDFELMRRQVAPSSSFGGGGDSSSSGCSGGDGGSGCGGGGGGCGGCGGGGD
ncbi:TIGR04222 domain-containing membrane protein [Myxococcus qinghaiensis]|uniref:TIGR04222 domain-containing membrane protein n=1 Tax=Myxococcus qinghaiensis TaxID=2906758 RepID=UPI0020A73318|nr:TIGR04222 domain-containing membrane protein [Myxococcus qinghaiensis]MCP3169740.1 TIGR04222 domain-containing membrane protein [Myxococcus qinghaiensis]